MLLHLGRRGIRYVTQLIALSNTNITSTGGTSLLPELWKKILELAIADTQESFCFVQAISLRDSSIGQVLRCGRTGSPHCGWLSSASDVYAFEDFINDPNQHAGDTLDILITSADDDLPADSACLFSDVTVPDIISRMKLGNCGLCRGDRWICPGCRIGPEDFGEFVGCGVSLVCPLCIGTEFSLRHKAFLKAYYWDEPPAEVEKSMNDEIRQRLKELGYIDALWFVGKRGGLHC
jgi:hypothetical protein